MTYLFIATWLLLAGLIGGGIYLSEQKSPDIVLIKYLFCTIFIIVPVLMATMILTSLHKGRRMWVIRLGWITDRSHPVVYYAVISSIVLFFAIPIMIGTLTAFSVIPFTIKIHGQRYSTGPVDTPAPITAPEAVSP